MWVCNYCPPFFWFLRALFLLLIFKTLLLSFRTLLPRLLPLLFLLLKISITFISRGVGILLISTLKCRIIVWTITTLAITTTNHGCTDSVDQQIQKWLWFISTPSSISPPFLIVPRILHTQRSARYKTFHLPNKEIPHPDYYYLSSEANLSHCIPILLRPTKQKIHIFSIGINDKSIISSNVNQLIELLFKLSSSSPTSNIPERAAAPSIQRRRPSVSYGSIVSNRWKMVRAGEEATV